MTLVKSYPRRSYHQESLQILHKKVLNFLNELFIYINLSRFYIFCISDAMCSTIVDNLSFSVGGLVNYTKILWSTPTLLKYQTLPLRYAFLRYISSEKYISPLTKAFTWVSHFSKLANLFANGLLFFAAVGIFTAITFFV